MTFNLRKVMFTEPIWLSGAPNGGQWEKSISNGYIDLDWIQGREIGVRVKFGNDITIVPWNKVLFAEESRND